MTFKLLSNRSSGPTKNANPFGVQISSPRHGTKKVTTGPVRESWWWGRLDGREADQKSVDGSEPLQIGPRIPAERPALPARKKTAIGGAVQSGTYHSLNATPLNAATPATPDAATGVKAP